MSYHRGEQIILWTCYLLYALGLWFQKVGFYSRVYHGVHRYSLLMIIPVTMKSGLPAGFHKKRNPFPDRASEEFIIPSWKFAECHQFSHNPDRGNLFCIGFLIMDDVLFLWMADIFQKLLIGFYPQRFCFEIKILFPERKCTIFHGKFIYETSPEWKL